MSTQKKSQQKPKAENDADAEMCDRIRNKGRTMVGKIMVDREAPESIVENRINHAVIETFEGMAGTIMQWLR